MVAIPTIVATAAGFFGSGSPGQPGVCDLSNTAIPLSPVQQTALGSPTTPLAAVGLAFGVQNYTCSARNVFVAAGAVAELFDISYLASTNSGLLSSVQNDLFNFWNSSDAGSTTVQQLVETLPNIVPAYMILAQHYFIRNTAGGISPTWDFRATQKFQGVENAVFVGKSLANIPDVDPTKNVPWLHVGKVSGDISNEIYRIFTVGGVAPSSCDSGASTKDISVKYTSQYWFYGGSLGLGSK
ncbi:hypothetical protein BDM02DRAFT_3086961 [Thelephora ganbajun]|uniref:Uncharacterized protein n=1 Tax=Thelephora ganbajun TaxID=370292 RepID=A0ACB6ZV85_THEGA|nr:hypothetical protein BDM02DRAFT_3086961 [Thelephora ganbajun]